MPETGQCRLCLLPDLVELRDSHYLPAGIYRVLRDEGEPNSNPVKLTKRSAVRTSSQMKAYLLCAECEQRLNKNGEHWMLTNCIRRDGRFPLEEVLAARTPDVASPGEPTKLYYAGGIPAVNLAAIQYFAASIFWRGSIHPWNEDGTIPIRLGPYQEDFRRYLMGLRPFPEKSALLVIVRSGKEVTRITYGPAGALTGACHIFRFPMPGFAFLLLVGNRIPAGPRKYCFVRGAGNPLIVTPHIDKLILGEAVKMRQKSMSRKKYLHR